MDEILARVKASRAVTGEDVLAARRAVYGGSLEISAGEIEMLFRIEEMTHKSDPAWAPLLAEATVDYLVHQAEPDGYVDEVKAGWLVDRISTDGMVKTAAELEVLVRVLEAAIDAPAKLAAFALRQVRAAVVDGAGPLAGIGKVHAGRVTRDEAVLLRRILYAFGGQGGTAITRDEAEVLFDINDASHGADNDPVWTDLFVKALANCIMAASGYSPPPRQVALAEEKRLDAPADGVGSFIAEMAVAGLRGIFDAYREPGDGDWAARVRKQKTAIQAAEVVTKDEGTWLAGRIGRDGELDPNEKALLRFIRDEATRVHPALRDLIARAA